MSMRFHPPYSISGGPGHALDAQRVPLEAVGAQDGTLTWASQDGDSFVWSQVDGIVLDKGQPVTVYDGDGRVVLRGFVTQRKGSWSPFGTVWQMEVSSAWWYLEKVALGGQVEWAGGEVDDRSVFVTPEQDLAVSIRAMIDRMTLAGVPLRAGFISPCFTMSQLYINNQTAARALVDVLTLIPDAMTRVRYDEGGLPLLDVIRRDDAETVVLELGSEPDMTTALDLEALDELRPDFVEVQYVDATVDGVLVPRVQRAGNPTAGVLGRQLVPFSGPGARGWRPPEIATVELRTMPLVTNGLDLWYALHPELADLQAYMIANGYSPLRPWIVSTGSANMSVPSGSNNWVTKSMPPLLTCQIDGVPVASLSGLLGHAVVEGELPEWWAETGIAKQRVRLMLRFVVGMASGELYYGEVAGLADYSFAVSGGGYFMADLEIEFDAIAVPYTTLTTIAKPSDLRFTRPSEDLANNLWKAQRFVPYTGTAVVGSQAPRIPMPGEKVCVLGGEPEWETAGAMVQETTLDLGTGVARVKMGTPQRVRTDNLIERFSRSATGTIVEL
jgi:hypothetical protein